MHYQKWRSRRQKKKRGGKLCGGGEAEARRCHVLRRI